MENNDCLVKTIRSLFSDNIIYASNWKGGGHKKGLGSLLIFTEIFYGTINFLTILKLINKILIFFLDVWNLCKGKNYEEYIETIKNAFRINLNRIYKNQSRIRLKMLAISNARENDVP